MYFALPGYSASNNFVSTTSLDLGMYELRGDLLGAPRQNGRPASCMLATIA
jgi:hypothetical protein